MKKELFICSKCGHAFETSEYRVDNTEKEGLQITTCPICGRKIFKHAA